ncbi:hypothetical protein F5B17DRAFT_410928 [Nemania serpens]|nr:hypothetical protein F5B17DRAFT_410928 [Nemania serpens]
MAVFALVVIIAYHRLSSPLVCCQTRRGLATYTYCTRCNGLPTKRIKKVCIHCNSRTAATNNTTLHLSDKARR